MEWKATPELFELFAKHGRVIEAKAWSETSVYSTSSGGGGVVSGGTGYVSAPAVSVHSSTATRSQIFIRTDDGQERSIDIYGAVPMRQGNLVTVVYVKRKGTDNGWPVLIMNHDTGAFNERALSFEFAAAQMSAARMLLLTAVLCFIAYLISRPLLPVLVLLGMIAVAYLRRRQMRLTWTRLRADAKALAARLAENSRALAVAAN